MTIHGAKGLESPFVIVLDANHTAGTHEHRGVLLDWPSNQSSPSHLSMYTLATLTSPRSEIRDKELAIAKNENWNLLYVAMTRAKQGLWISGVAYSKGNDIGVDEKSWYSRALQGNLPLFEEDLLAPAIADLGVSENNTPQETNQAGVVFSIDDFQIKWEAAKTHQQQLISQIEDGIVLDAFASVVDQNALNPDILEQGKHFHRLMESFSMQTGVTPANLPDVQELAVWFNIDRDLASLALERAQAVLNAPALKPYLTAGDWIAAWNELDIVSTSGKSFRLDRLVEFPDRLVILDFKLTIPSVEDAKTQVKTIQYREQLNNYVQELTRIRPDKLVEAYLVSATGEIQQII
jgi:ATP-dependent helicase/nuclease subunit A